MIERILSGLLSVIMLALAAFTAWIGLEDLNSSMFILTAGIAWLAFGLGLRAAKG